MGEMLLQEHILSLERRLLQDEVRGSVNELEMLLADDYLEFEKSGRVYNKKQEIEGLIQPSGTLGKTTIMDVNTKLLSPDVVLLTYRLLVHKDMRYSLRSSIWKLNDERWQLVFHQGTSTAAP